MAKMIAFMATWTTYGTWLQGNKKGYVKNGTILEANVELEKSNKELLKHDKIKIPKGLRETVKKRNSQRSGRNRSKSLCDSSMQ